MVTMQDIKRNAIPIAIGGSLLLYGVIGIGASCHYYRLNQIAAQQNPAVEARPSEQPDLEARLTPTAQVAVPPKPSSVDINMFVSDFSQIKPLVEYISFQLGYPLSPQQEIIFLPKEEFEPMYMKAVGTDVAGPAYTDFFIKNGELNSKSYIRQDNLYEIIGPVFHELGQYNISNQNRKNGKSDNSALVSRETASYAIHSAGLSVLEEEFGLDGLFLQPHGQNRNIMNALTQYRKNYFESGFQPSGGFLAYWLIAFKEPQLTHIAEELLANKKLSSKFEMEIFRFLTQQNNQYIRGMLSGMTEDDFKNIERIITSRAINTPKYPLKRIPWDHDYLLTKSVKYALPHQNL